MCLTPTSGVACPLSLYTMVPTSGDQMMALWSKEADNKNLYLHMHMHTQGSV
jgi:hypothetical protein